jgi:hypothetical protein
MRFNETFSVESLPQATNNYDPIHAGWYNATINSAELKDTKSGTGQYINVRYDIMGETHAGRVVFGMINIRNANPKAEEIGRAQLGELLRAIGKPSVNDTDELLGASLTIKVAISEREGYDPRNEVKGFKALAGGMPTAVAKAAPVKAEGGKATAPWEKAPF